MEIKLIDYNERYLYAEDLSFVQIFKVFLVRKTTGKDAGEIFAMKVLKKVKHFTNFVNLI